MIALFTDFGLSGPYTGQVKAVLAREAPGVPIVDLFADLPAGNPKSAAYLLAAYAVWFAPPIVLLAVVDPGVGGTRRAIVVEADGRFYVGPENGLFESVLRRAGSVRGWEIVWRPDSLSPSSERARRARFTPSYRSDIRPQSRSSSSYWAVTCSSVSGLRGSAAISNPASAACPPSSTRTV